MRHAITIKGYYITKIKLAYSHSKIDMHLFSIQLKKKKEAATIASGHTAEVKWAFWLVW